MTVTSAPNFCGQCGKAFGQDSRFCANCGSSRVASPAAPSPAPQQPRSPPAQAVPKAGGRKWFRREPMPIVFGVGSFVAIYAVFSLPAERIRMPIILMPLYYGLGPEVFFGVMSAILGVVIWAGVKFGD